MDYKKKLQKKNYITNYYYIQIEETLNHLNKKINLIRIRNHVTSHYAYAYAKKKKLVASARNLQN